MAGMQIEVDTSKVREALTTVDNETANFKISFDNIYTCIDSIIDKQAYLGADAQKFVEKINGFKDDFSDLYNKLTEYSNFLNKAIDAYDTAQTDVKTRASKLKESRG